MRSTDTPRRDDGLTVRRRHFQVDFDDASQAEMRNELCAGRAAGRRDDLAASDQVTFVARTSGLVRMLWIGMFLSSLSRRRWSDMARWQVQEAKQRLSELLRYAHEDGPQVITRHGEEIAVVLDMDQYRRLRGQRISFKDLLTSGPLNVPELEVQRPETPSRIVEL